MSDFAEARRNMVDSQLLTEGVTDRHILTAFGSLPRELFLPSDKRDLAYSDATLQVWSSFDGTSARYLPQPVVLARLIQLASIAARDSVLDIGCATGYSTAILARLALSVTAVEVEPELAAVASKNLAALDIDNATIIIGDLSRGAPQRGPFDVVLLNGSVPELSDSLFDQLNERGRLVSVVAKAARGKPLQGKAFLFVKVKGKASGVPRFDANAKPLPGFALPPMFAF
jgi:protein-L-isoaspartate(D-aspartate) O-methyltransferase